MCTRQCAGPGRQSLLSNRQLKRWHEPSRLWRTTIVNLVSDQLVEHNSQVLPAGEFSRLLEDDLLTAVVRPAQYLGNEWGAARKPWNKASVHLALAFPDLYELGMSNFGLRILYQIVNSHDDFMADRTYAPDSDLEKLLRKRHLPLWGWESRRALSLFELIGFSLQYELTYTNVLNMLDLSGIPVLSSQRMEIFPLVFAGGPCAVNPEPMAKFMDFFVIGDGEKAVPQILEIVKSFKASSSGPAQSRRQLLNKLSAVPGIYVPGLYELKPGAVVAVPVHIAGQPEPPERVLRQVEPLNDANQPAGGIVPYLSLVHDRAVLEVRRGCDRGCRFCQPGYTFLPVRERSADDLLRLSRIALDKSGQQEYSMLSLCVSDYTSLHETVRALNRQHAASGASLSFPSQRADRMNLDLALELKSVRKSGITLAPEAGSERLRAVINKGLSHAQIISAIAAAYEAGWLSVKLYFMLGLPTERDEDLSGIIDILVEATEKCRNIRRADRNNYKRNIEFTCTISNFVPKPFTPFQWFAQISPLETERRQDVLKAALKKSGLKNVTLNFTEPRTSLLEAVLSRGDRSTGDLIYSAWRKGATFDAWEDRLQPDIWRQAAEGLGINLADLACTARELGSRQPWDIVHAGLNDWWLVNEWQKAMSESETAPCTEHTCHACGVCTELDTTHRLAEPKPEVMKKNPFVKELSAHGQSETHPSLFFMKPAAVPSAQASSRMRFQFKKEGQMRFISHLDLQHLFARAARRAGIALSFSQGFNPAPKLALAQALPLFQEGLAEVGEVDLELPGGACEFMEAMNSQLPPEVQIEKARCVNMQGPSLASQVGRARYRATLCSPAAYCAGSGSLDDAADISGVPERIAEILAASRLEIEHKGHKDDICSSKDIRPGIYCISPASEKPLTLHMELACGPAMHVKPLEVLNLLFLNADWRVTRLGLATPDGTTLFDLC